MSLINQMLQDLESRRAGDVRSAMPNELRPLPGRQPRRLGPWLWGGALALAFGGGGFFLAREFALPSLPSAPVPVVQAPPASPALVPVTQGAPDSSAVASVPAVDAALAPAPSPDAVVGGALRLSDSISAVPPASSVSQARAAVQPVAAAPSDAGKMPSAPKVADSNGPVAVGTTAVLSPRGREVRPPEEGRIEKTPLQPSSQEKAEAEYRRGVSMVNQGQMKEGAESLRQCLRLDGSHAAARQLLLRLVLEQRGYDEARGLLEEGVRLQPGRYQWALTLARLLVDRNDPAAAWQALQGSMGAAAASADYQGLAGNVLQRLGRPRESADYYRAALRIAPNDGRWWLGLGLALEAEGNSPEARQAFQSARASGNLSPELTAFVDQRLR